MTVLVTGGSGFIGRSVVRLLVERGEAPVVLPHRWRGLKGLESLLPPGDVDGCIHLGWYADTRDYLVNVAENRQSLEDSLDLVEIMGLRGCKGFVVAGTSAEYATSDQALSEVAPIAPWSVYGAAKASPHQRLTHERLTAGQVGVRLYPEGALEFDPPGGDRLLDALEQRGLVVLHPPQLLRLARAVEVIRVLVDGVECPDVRPG